jgi:hypothetical protein
MHFTRPDVTDPWYRLARLNVAYWSQWAQDQVRNPWLVAAVATGSVTLVRRHRAFGLIAGAVALTGFLNQAAHPLVNQSDRLLIEVSVAAVLGLPLLGVAADRRRGHHGRVDRAERDHDRPTHGRARTSRPAPRAPAATRRSLRTWRQRR